MPARSLPEPRANARPDDAVESTDTARNDPSQSPETTATGTSRRRFLAGGAAAITTGLAGCAGRVPGRAAAVDVAARIDDGRLIWDYPARAVDGDGSDDGIGYAAVGFEASDPSGPEQPADPVLRFGLNSTVGGIAADEPFEGYRADRFRFRIGLPPDYEDAASLEAFVQPTSWPELTTTYGYRGSSRELVVCAPEVGTAGTITVAGGFRPAGATLPRRLTCGFEVRASRPTPFGRSVVAADRRSFDLSAIDIPDSVTLE
jgi:hypothetical protein